MVRDASLRDRDAQQPPVLTKLPVPARALSGSDVQWTHAFRRIISEQPVDLRPYWQRGLQL